LSLTYRDSSDSSVPTQSHTHMYSDVNITAVEEGPSVCPSATHVDFIKTTVTATQVNTTFLQRSTHEHVHIDTNLPTSLGKKLMLFSPTLRYVRFDNKLQHKHSQTDGRSTSKTTQVSKHAVKIKRLNARTAATNANPPDLAPRKRTAKCIYSAHTVVYVRCSGMDHTVLPANDIMPAFTS